MVAHVGGWFEIPCNSSGYISCRYRGRDVDNEPLAARLIDIYSWRTTYRIFAVVGSLIYSRHFYDGASARRSGAAPSRVEAFDLRLSEGCGLQLCATPLPYLFPLFCSSVRQRKRNFSCCGCNPGRITGGSSVLSRIGFSWLTSSSERSFYSVRFRALPNSFHDLAFGWLLVRNARIL